WCVPGRRGRGRPLANRLGARLTGEGGRGQERFRKGRRERERPEEEAPVAHAPGSPGPSAPDARQLEDGAGALVDPLLADQPVAAVVPKVDIDLPRELVVVDRDDLPGDVALLVLDEGQFALEVAAVVGVDDGDGLVAQGGGGQRPVAGQPGV